MATTPSQINSAYVVTAQDFTGDVYRPNSIFQSINARLSAVESAASSTTKTASSASTSTNINSGYYVDTITSNAVTPDLGLAFTHETVINQAAQITIDNPIYTGGTISPGQDLYIILVQDSTGNRVSPLWGSNFAGTANISIAPDANTYSVVQFKVRSSDSKFALMQFTTGVPR